MASIRRKAKSRFCWACITLPGGKQRQFSTGIEDEAEALAIAQEAETAARRHAQRPHQLRAAFARIAEDVIGHRAEDPATWLSGWARARSAEVERSTAAAYATAARDAGEWFAAAGIRSLDAITPRHLEQLRDHLAGRTSPATANGKLKILRMALKSAVRDKLIPENPAAAVAAAKSRATVRREFTPAEIELLLPALTGEWRALFFMGLFTGQRLNDLAELRWHQLDLQRATLGFIARKTGATVALPLVPQIVDSLAELPSSDDPRAPVFPCLHALRRPSRSTAFRDILAGVGLAVPVDRYRGSRPPRESRSRQTSELSFHSLRHTATTMLKAAGVADSIARAIIGHESAAVSRVYTHLDMETMRTALMRISRADPAGSASDP